jgi:hypothetical protein
MVAVSEKLKIVAAKLEEENNDCRNIITASRVTLITQKTGYDYVRWRVVGYVFKFT